MIPTARILVVDDEANIRSSLEEMLTYAGHEVVAVASGEAALKLIAVQERFDLALIDLKLEGTGGMEVLTMLRQQSPETVVIVLTAYASLETAVEALRKGAHDYLFKPCKMAELQESIRRGLLNRQPELQQQALLRQLNDLAGDLEDIRATIIGQQSVTPPVAADIPSSPAALPTVIPAEPQTRFLAYGDLVVDFLRHAITLEGHLLDLSPTEFNLLAYLISQAPRVVSSQELSREVQKYESEQWEASEAVRQHIYRLRQKMRDVSEEADIIRTVRGVGYTIDE